MINRYLLAAILFAATTGPGVAATDITVANVGSLLNESVALPAESTPGLGGAFEQFFEFSLPVGETVTVSMSDSATGSQQITSGVLSLNDWTSTGSTPPFVPAGALIESSLLENVVGGQEATVTPDVLGPGAYFVELSGNSGLSPIRIAVDGTATATVPEASTWIMFIVGLAFMAWVGRRHVSTHMVDSPT
jgi:hypothetical protein